MKCEELGCKSEKHTSDWIVIATGERGGPGNYKALNFCSWACVSGYATRQWYLALKSEPYKEPRWDERAASPSML